MRGTFKARLVGLLMVLCAVVLVAVGCGSDDEGGSSEDPQAEIRALVVETFAFEDPTKICEENLTDSLLGESYEGEDREARLEDCIEDEPADVGEIEFRKVKVEGNTATAAVEAVRSNGRSSKFTVELVDEDGWKIDGIG